jgi:hypothetical protein
MGKHLQTAETEIVMAVDWDVGVLDLRIFATHPKKEASEVVGEARFRLKDLRQIVEMLTERVYFVERIDARQAGRKAKDRKRYANARAKVAGPVG